MSNVFENASPIYSVGHVCKTRTTEKGGPIVLSSSNFDNSKKEAVVKIIVKTHRYTFGNEFITILGEFARKHQDDERKCFKKAWEKWIYENNVIVQEEIKTMKNNGFDGDVLDKMFKSARYYYRKKTKKNEKMKEEDTENQDTENQDTENEISTTQNPTRKKNEYLSTDILHEMDAHIIEQIKKNITHEESNVLKIGAIPAKSFDEYCLQYKARILEQSTIYSDGQPLTKAHIENTILKLKKTYKNRFYIKRSALV